MFDIGICLIGCFCTFVILINQLLNLPDEILHSWPAFITEWYSLFI